jgi:hypothetical protein
METKGNKTVRRKEENRIINNEGKESTVDLEIQTRLSQQGIDTSSLH